MSGGNYPSSYHLQSPQGYMTPRHRLPIIPSHRSTSYTTSSIGPAHISQTSPWANKPTYPNYHEAASAYYSPASIPRGYTPPRSHFTAENAARWATEQPFINAAAAAMASSNPYEQLEKFSAAGSAAASFFKGMQQQQQHESMDLSSAAHLSATVANHKIAVPPAAHSRSDVNGEVSRRTVSLKNSNKSSSAERNKQMLRANVDVIGSMKKDGISVIAENPIRDKVSSADDTSIDVSGDFNFLASKPNDFSPSSHVSSHVLPFDKRLTTNKVKSGNSVDVDSLDDSRTISATKSPSSYNDLTITKLPLTRPESVAAKQTSSSNIIDNINNNNNAFKYAMNEEFELTSKTSNDSTGEAFVNKQLESTLSNTNDVQKSKLLFETNNAISDNVESILENMFHATSTDNSNSTSMPSTGVLQSSVIVSASKSAIQPVLKTESVEKMLKSPSPEKGDVADIEKQQLDDVGTKQNCSSVDERNHCEQEKKTTVAASSVEVNDNRSKLQLDSIDAAKLMSDKRGDAPDNRARKERKRTSGNEEEDEDDDAGQLIINESADDKLLKESSNIVVKVEKSAGDDTDVARVVNSSSKNDTNAAIPEKDTIVKVETELEKLFAGIMDTSQDTSVAAGTSTTEYNSSASVVKDEIIKLENSVPTKAAGVNDLINNTPSTSTPCTNEKSTALKKKQKLKNRLKMSSSTKKKDTKESSAPTKDKAKHPQRDTSNETTSSSSKSLRVPIIHIEGTKELPTSVTIINNGMRHEEDDMQDGKVSVKKKLKVDPNKKLSVNYNYCKNYDPVASDESWVCIFCKLGPHCPGVGGDPSGDLFGPYFISAPDLPDNKKRPRKGPTDPVKRKKRSLCDSGINTTAADDNTQLEVWGHENCFIWASGVHLLGSTLVGIEDAVHSALVTKCRHCGELGASIGCQMRHCKACVHYSCGLYSGWNLSRSTFSTICNLHRVPD